MTAEHDAAGAAPEDANGGAPQRGSAKTTPLLEWLVGGLGLMLVCGAVGFLVYHSLTRDRTPPDIRVVAEQVLALGNGYLVQFRAFNQGRAAAAQVTIEGELRGPDGATEVAETVLDYLPPRSERAGGLLFTTDPRAGELQLRPRGYAEP